MLIVFFLAATVFSGANALTCHQVGSGNVSVEDTSTSTDCGIGSLTCVKVVDLTHGTYTKQCQSMNCTLNGVSNAVANCMNTTTLAGSMLSCCCYGDGCNAAPQSFNSIPAVILAAVSAIYYFS